MNSRFNPSISSSRCDGKSENEMNKGDEESSNYPGVSILSMSGGDGHNSYATNSLLQRRVLSMTKPILVKNTKEMMKNLDFPKCIKLADLGCSSGQNTFVVMSEIVNTIYVLCQEWNQSPPEIDCCLNDLPGNDFNTTFKFISFFNDKLRSKTPCFVSGVPGSFYSGLFPRKSLDDPLYRHCCHWLTLLSDSLRDLVFEGLLSASKVNSFNVPFYDPNRGEVKEIIRNEGSFLVNDLEDTHVFDLRLSNEDYNLESEGEKEANCIRSVTETMLVAHFGDSINIDTLFEKYAHHVSQHASCKNKTSVSLVVSLVRK